MAASRRGTNLVPSAGKARSGWWGSAVEQTADSVLVTDHEGVIQYVNPGFVLTTGFSAEEAIGRTPRILKSGKHDAEFYGKLWATILSGRPYRALVVNRRKEGALYSAQLSISPIRNRRGRVTHFVSVQRDVTELLRSKERDMEMELARQVQDRFYGAATQVRGFDIAGTTVQVQGVGGDYFDFIPLRDGRLIVVVADASGHGIPAALVMAETRSCLRTLCQRVSDPGEILTEINIALARDLMDNQFVTLFLARLDPADRTLVYSNAGHVPGVLMDNASTVRTRFPSLGPPLGIVQGQSYPSSACVQLSGGDVLLFMSDGVLETRDASGDEFGVERAANFIASRRGESALKILEGLQAMVRAFEADAAVRDDVTAVVLKCVS
jgi:sigma-B regulation protein RsbU (phosphoserine phosphatase)